MIFLRRRRLIFWLFKAYIKKWRRTIFTSFIIGLVVFFILRYGLNFIFPLVPFSQKETVGLVGVYSTENLPPIIVSKLSRGLTKVDIDQSIKPDIASSWEIKNGGKRYVFHLKDNIFFNDGSKITSNNINYNFKDVTVEKPDEKTIIFNLKNQYAPFLVTTSRPIFKKNYIGTGDYRVQSIKVNGNFVQSVSLISTSLIGREISYQFYPTEESLKIAFILGEVSKIYGVKDAKVNGFDLSKFPNVNVERKIDYSSLVTLFYNTQNSNLSDKRLREALSYTIPDKFSEGQRNYGPFVPKSWVAKNGLSTYNQDLEHSRLLLKEDENSSRSASMVLEISTLKQYEELAKNIVGQWKKIGINGKIIVVNSLPSNFQVFLGDFSVPKDPDQYTLWHSSQSNNITNYKNLRIDKLLEDGRQTSNIEERTKIYTDFQKYLLDDPPATFLYFPYSYEITRK